MALRGAVDDLIRPVTPCRRISLPPIPRTELVMLTQTEARRLLTAAWTCSVLGPSALSRSEHSVLGLRVGDR